MCTVHLTITFWILNCTNCAYVMDLVSFTFSRSLSNFVYKQNRFKFSTSNQCTLFAQRDISYLNCSNRNIDVYACVLLQMMITNAMLLPSIRNRKMVILCKYTIPILPGIPVFSWLSLYIFGPTGPISQRVIFNETRDDSLNLLLLKNLCFNERSQSNRNWVFSNQLISAFMHYFGQFRSKC